MREWGKSRLIHASDMRVIKTLASGTIIRQDFRTAAQFVFFDTGDEHWQYATHGGTMFVVRHQGKPYGLICRHVLKDFHRRQLVVTDRRQGNQIAGLRSVAYPSEPKDAAIDTDLLDVAVIQVSDDVDAVFFKDAAYILDEKTLPKCSCPASRPRRDRLSPLERGPPLPNPANTWAGFGGEGLVGAAFREDALR